MDYAVRFAVIADLHVDIMPDAVSRMQAFCEAAVESRADFLLHLGDMMYPEEAFIAANAPESLEKRKKSWFICDRDDEKLAVKKLIADTGLPMYGTLGNHDMDSCTKATTCAYWGMPAPYYTFVEGGVRFLVLDTNFFRENGRLVDYAHCNYAHAQESAFLSPEELAWAEETIMASAEPCVLTAHSALGDDILYPVNRGELWDMIARTNRDKRRVILALNGHNHVDGVSVRNGVPFISINSASNIWIGHDYDTVRYSETISRLYPHIKGTAPYRDALFAIFEITPEGIRVTGRQSGFVGPAPQALDFPEAKSFFDPCACIRDRFLPMAALPGDGKTSL